MKQSLTYYITLLFIKLKGLKKDFSKDPIDLKKIRKEDVHHPKGAFFKSNTLRKFEILDSKITEIAVHPDSENLLIFIHGGAFISGPSQHHWDSIKTIAQHTKHKIWMCNYPKAPENKITEISKNIDAIYSAALNNFSAHKVSIIGDSAGGTLATSLIQRLILNQSKLPHQLILISPVMDASMSNSEIEETDKRDPMLSTKGVLSAKKMCIENNDLKNVMISPLYGSFESFPRTAIFMAENDITYPDQKLAVQKFIKAKVNIELIEGKNMPHIWPFLPVMKEAKRALKEVIRILNH